MFGADIVVVEAASFIHRQLDDFLGSRRETDLTQHDMIASADSGFDLAPGIHKLDSHSVEYLGRDTLAFAEQSQQQVLGTDVILVEPLRFLLCQAKDLTSPLGKLIKSISVLSKPHCETSQPAIWTVAGVLRRQKSSTDRDSRPKL